VSTSSAAHIFQILRLVCNESKPLGATEISKRLGLSLTTAHRGLHTLDTAGYLSRYQSSARFEAGPACRSLMHGFFAKFPLRDVAIPYLQRLSVMSGETASLFVPVGGYVLRIASLKGTNEVIQTASLGETRALHDSAAGYAMAAWQSSEQRRRYCEVTGQTLDEARIAEIRKVGFAVGTGSADDRHVAFPILGEQDAVLGAIALEGSVWGNGNQTDAAIDTYKVIARHMSEVAQSNSTKYRDIFAHLDLAEVELPVAS